MCTSRKRVFLQVLIANGGGCEAFGPMTEKTADARKTIFFEVM